MKSIKFTTGYKEYMLNDDPDKIIKINVADLNLAARIKEVQPCFDEIEKKYKQQNKQPTAQEIAELDKQIREKVNYAFDTDICTPAFGNTNCMSPVGSGKMLFEAFFDAFMPIIEADMKSAAQAQAIHIEEKANKYISAAQSAPVDPQISVANAHTSDISNLTQEQKDAMLMEMLRQGK